jgi:hypothetical protein
MDKNICFICKKEIQKGNHFWKEHRLKESVYYEKYFPKFCKQTGEKLVFKNVDNYFSNDFKGKREMAQWFKSYPDEAKLYAVELLKQRKEKKNLIYSPSQVELRSIMCPSMIWFKKNFQGYNLLCEDLGLKTRFDLENETPQFNEIDGTILIDSREQKPLKFKSPTKTIGLRYGDYALEPNRFKIHIERKNLSDFVSTFGVGFDRFCREVNRAKKDRAYLIILVESTLNDALHFNYLPQTKYCKTNPDFVFHNVRDLLQRFSNVQFLFCDGRKEMAELVKKIFGMKRHPKHFDLQFLKDTKQL